MTPSLAVGSCLEHPDRPGTPCPRCGTFRCASCLAGGLCGPCTRSAGRRAPVPEDSVGFGRRVGGRAIDLVGNQVAAFTGGVAVILLHGFLQAFGLFPESGIPKLGHGAVFNFFAGATAGISGAALSTWICGASIGKAMLGMRVVTIDGERPGPFASVVREVLYYVDAFFFGMVAKSAMDKSALQQRVGDSAANTVVVRADAVSPVAVSSAPRLAVGLMAGFALHAAVLAGLLLVAEP
jgi:uncharacterized RDD family membrane protein YckC